MTSSSEERDINMTRRNAPTSRLSSVLIGLGLGLGLLANQAQADAVVIVHPSNATALDDEQISKIFPGGAKPPKELGSDDEVLKFVAATPGAIGYVEAGKANSSVKVVKR